MKTPKGQGVESFGVGEHIQVLGEWHTQRSHGGSALLPLDLTLCISFIWLLEL